MSYRLGVDVGGTFTDLLLFDESSKTLTLEKVPTTVDDQAAGIIEGIERVTSQAGVAPSRIKLLLHGTTVATNAILEHKGVKTDRQPIADQDIHPDSMRQLPHSKPAEADWDRNSGRRQDGTAEFRPFAGISARRA